MMAYSPRSKLGTLLPDFPDIKDLKLPPNIPEDKVSTFLLLKQRVDIGDPLYPLCSFLALLRMRINVHRN